jgi:hypothetical protein
VAADAQNDAQLISACGRTSPDHAGLRGNIFSPRFRKLVLSNAERQKRHRERVKNKLSTLVDNGRGDDTNGGDDVLKELLVGQFLAAGNDMLALNSDEIREAARVEFLRIRLTVLDIIDTMQEAGQRAALKIYEPLACAWMDRRRANAPPVAIGETILRPPRRRSRR